MAEKTHQQVYPLAPANGRPRSDEESATLQKELRKKKRIKCALYIVAFAVFQTIVITVFALTVMRVKTPKVKLSSAGPINPDFKTGNKTSPSFDMKFTAQLTIKNKNFGPFKYDSTNVTFTYERVTVGQFNIPKSKAGLLSTKKVSVPVDLNSSSLSSNSPALVALGSELGSGILTLSIQAKLSGKVELMFVMKKKKSTQLNCTLKITVSTKSVDINCK